MISSKAFSQLCDSNNEIFQYVAFGTQNVGESANLYGFVEDDQSGGLRTVLIERNYFKNTSDAESFDTNHLATDALNNRLLVTDNGFLNNISEYHLDDRAQRLSTAGDSVLRDLEFSNGGGSFYNSKYYFFDNGVVINQATATADDEDGNSITDLSDDPNDEENEDKEGDLATLGDQTTHGTVGTNETIIVPKDNKQRLEPNEADSWEITLTYAVDENASGYSANCEDGGGLANLAVIDDRETDKTNNEDCVPVEETNLICDYTTNYFDYPIDDTNAGDFRSETGTFDREIDNNAQVQTSDNVSVTLTKSGRLNTLDVSGPNTNSQPVGFAAIDNDSAVLRPETTLNSSTNADINNPATATYSFDDPVSDLVFKISHITKGRRGPNTNEFSNEFTRAKFFFEGQEVVPFAIQLGQNTVLDSGGEWYRIDPNVQNSGTSEDGSVVYEITGKVDTIIVDVANQGTDTNIQGVVLQVLGACSEINEVYDVEKTNKGRAVQKADGTYDVTFTIVAKNSGNTTLQYQLTDTVKPTPGVTFNSSFYTRINAISSSKEGDLAETGDQSTYGTIGTNSTIIVPNSQIQTLSPGESDNWGIVVNLSVDATNPGYNTQCDQSSDGVFIGGFVNLAEIDDRETDRDNNEVCTPVIDEGLQCDYTVDYFDYPIDTTNAGDFRAATNTYDYEIDNNSQVQTSDDITVTLTKSGRLNTLDVSQANTNSQPVGFGAIDKNAAVLRPQTTFDDSTNATIRNPASATYSFSEPVSDLSFRISHITKGRRGPNTNEFSNEFSRARFFYQGEEVFPAETILGDNTVIYEEGNWAYIDPNINESANDDDGSIVYQLSGPIDTIIADVANQGIDSRIQGVVLEVLGGCTDVDLDVTKTAIDSDIDLASRTAQVTYDILVTNTGVNAGVYDLNDVITSTESATYQSASYTYINSITGVEIDGSTNTSGLFESNPYTFVNDETIQAGKVDAWRIVVNFSLNSSDINEITNQTCNTDGNPKQAEGFTNSADVIVGGSIQKTDHDCVPVTGSQINLVKSVDASVYPIYNASDDTYRVVYRIQAINSGNAVGEYDLVDMLDLGAGINVALSPRSSLTYVSGDGAQGSLSTGADNNGNSIAANQKESVTLVDGTEVSLVTGESLAGSGAIELWELEVFYNVDQDVLTLASASCMPDPVTAETGGFGNEVSGVEGEVKTDDNRACVNAPLADLEITKMVDSGPSLVDGSTDTYEVVYRVTAVNTGDAPANYDVVDELDAADGSVNGVSVVAGYPTIVYGGELDGNQGVITSPFEVGETAVSGERLGVNQTESFIITARFMVDPTIITSVDDLTCQTTTETETGGGAFYNSVETQGGTDIETDNEVCPPLPNSEYDIEKVANGAAVDNGDGTYTVMYTITASNTGEISAQYTLIDVVQESSTVSVSSASYSYAGASSNLENGIASSGTSNSATINIAGVGSEQSLLVDETDTWIVTVRFIVDENSAEFVSECRVDSNGDFDGGLVNRVVVNENETDDTNNEACVPVGDRPQIELTKTAIGEQVTMNTDGTYTVSYQIIARNIGQESGTYNLEDTLNSASGVSVSQRIDPTLMLDFGTGSGGSLTEKGNDTNVSPIVSARVYKVSLAVGTESTLVVDRSLASNAVDVWILQVTYDVDAEMVTTETASCTTDTDGSKTGGFANHIEGSSTPEDMSDNDACLALPEPEEGFELSKQADGAPVNNGDGTYTVSYTIIAQNTGDVSVEYALTDRVEPTSGVSFVLSSYSLISEQSSTLEGSLASSGTNTTAGSNVTVMVPETNEQSLSVDEKDTWSISIVYRVDVTVANFEGACTQDPDGSFTGGLVNSVDIDPRETNETNNTACVPINAAQIDLSKVAEEDATLRADIVTTDGSSIYEMTYTIVAQNFGTDSGMYNLVDTLKLGAGIELYSGREDGTNAVLELISSSAGNTGGVINSTDTSANPISILNPVRVTLSDTIDNMLVMDRGLSTNGVDRWELRVLYRVDATGLVRTETTDSGNCNTTESGEKVDGFSNWVSGSSSDTNLTNNADCKPVPDSDLTITKNVVSGPTELDNGNFQVVYSITVENISDSPSTYTLSDRFNLGSGIGLVPNPTIAYSPEPSTDKVAETTATSPFIPGSNAIVTNEPISARGKEVWRVTAEFNVNELQVDITTVTCINIGTTTASGGFANTATIIDRNTNSDTDNDCVPYEELGGLVSGIGDYVWYDLDGDQAQDVFEPGIPGVTLNLYDGNGELYATTVTDPSGNYLFDSLLADSYTVEIDITTLPSLDAEYVCNTNEPLREDGACDKVVVDLGEGEDIDDVDFGFVSYGTIGDTIWWDNGVGTAPIEGTPGLTRGRIDGMMDPQEPRLSDVKVTLTGTDIGGALVNRETTTDVNGQYLFEKLVSGEYTIIVDEASIVLAASQLSSASTLLREDYLVQTYDDETPMNDSQSKVDFVFDVSTPTSPTLTMDGENTSEDLGQDFGYFANLVLYSGFDSYTVVVDEQEIVLTFKTINEVDSAGFVIYGKADDEKLIKLSDTIRSKDQGQGATYEVKLPRAVGGEDLQELYIVNIDVNSASNTYGPFKVKKEN